MKKKNKISDKLIGDFLNNRLEDSDKIIEEIVEKLKYENNKRIIDEDFNKDLDKIIKEE